MDEKPPYLDDIQNTQDEIAFKRITAWELRRLTRMAEVLTEQINALQTQVNAHKPAAIPWWVQAMLAIMITLCGGYIGLVHNLSLSNRGEIMQVREKQQSLWWIEQEIKKMGTGSEDRAIRIDRMENAIKYWNERFDQQSKRLFSLHERLDRCCPGQRERGTWDLPGLIPEESQRGLGRE